MDVRELVFATTNNGKFLEVARVAKLHGWKFRSLDEFSSTTRSPPLVRELGNSHQEIAIWKSKAYSSWLGQCCIADDSGLEVEAFGGLPGIYTAVFGLQKFLSFLPYHNEMPASFVCSMCYSEPSRRTVCSTARLLGVVRRHGDLSVSSNDPLPYSSFFYPFGESQTLTELSKQGPYRSHRVTALEQLLKAIGVNPDTAFQRKS